MTMFVTKCTNVTDQVSRLYCGFEDAIEVFDVHYPGEGTRLRTVPTKKSRDGLRGKWDFILLIRGCPLSYSPGIPLTPL